MSLICHSFGRKHSSERCETTMLYGNDLPNRVYLETKKTKVHWWKSDDQITYKVCNHSHTQTLTHSNTYCTIVCHAIFIIYLKITYV